MKKSAVILLIITCVLNLYSQQLYPGIKENPQLVQLRQDLIMPMP